MNTPDDIVYHRQVKSHTGMIWECHGAPDDAAVRRETDRLVAAGGVVVTRPKSPRETLEVGDFIISTLAMLSGGLFLLLMAFMLGRGVLDKFLPNAWDAGWHIAAVGAVTLLAGSVALVVFMVFLACIFYSMALSGVPRHMR